MARIHLVAKTVEQLRAELVLLHQPLTCCQHTGEYHVPGIGCTFTSNWRLQINADRIAGWSYDICPCLEASGQMVSS